jgi:sulfide:quinone oxidoreductase
MSPDPGARVVILGGGVAGLEALLALHDLAGDRGQLTLVSADPEFVYKPMLVEEPFDLDPAARHELAPLAAELGVRFENRAVSSVDPYHHLVALADGSKLEYDYLVACLGGRYRPALEHARTFPSADDPLRLDELLTQEGPRHVVFVVPLAVSWSLPIYELSLMTQSRVRGLGRGDVQLTVVTAEDAPLAVFGPVASSAVADLLSGRGIDVVTGSVAREDQHGTLVLTPGDRVVGATDVIALPAMDGPGLDGLPSDDDGFIPIDDHARVRGVEDVYAAGDGTDFPVKQGGIGTQQADAAAEDIAHRLGAAGAPQPFHPVLRGKLLTGDESLHMKADITGGAGEGEASPDALWWPPQKVSGRYLAPFLYHGSGGAEPEPPRRPLEVEVSLPKEWHGEPLSQPARRGS